MTESTQAPRWDLSNVYPNLESQEFKAALQDFESKIQALEELFATRIAPSRQVPEAAILAALLGEAVRRFNDLYELMGTLHAYISSFVSTDSRDLTARRIMSQFQQTGVRVHQLGTRFQAWIGSLAGQLDALVALDETVQAHAFALRETAEQSQYLMSEVEESLASELGLSGHLAWAKLQGTITSQLSVDFELGGEMRKLPLPALINLHSHPDPQVRQRAYHAEIQALQSIEEPIAACLNGIKGTTITLNRRRGREDALHSAIDMARIDRPTLEAMLAAMEASFPTFRKYYKAKARRFGKDQLAWWDVFAPAGKSEKTYSFSEARQFILDNFAKFTPELAVFAQRAFDNHWIDAEQRDGKRGGAFCMGVPGVKESRVLSNFDGSLDQVSTIAHELGHAFHNECKYQAGKTSLQQRTPMTLAETASIMCETVVMEAVLAETADPQEQLAILETMLIGDSQVIVDIYSRYLFEKEVFEHRAEAELSAVDFCDIMELAQEATYGDGLDPQYRHKFMWTWKPHYYSAELSFYNFPYAFGLLFGIGLYAIYQQRGAAFIPDYVNLLASTGEGDAATLAARFGIDIRQRKFWEDSLAVIAARVERYCAL